MTYSWKGKFKNTNIPKNDLCIQWNLNQNPNRAFKAFKKYTQKKKYKKY